MWMNQFFSYVDFIYVLAVFFLINNRYKVSTYVDSTDLL